MSIKNVRQHYVALVPYWISDAVNATLNQDPEVFTDYEKLSSILSSSDVCFYHLMQSLRPKLVTGFADMVNISMKSNNLKWLDENAAALKSASDKFQLLPPDSDALECGTYKALAAGTDTVVLLSHRGDSSGLSLAKKCLMVMSTQMSFDEYKLYDIFSDFTVV